MNRTRILTGIILAALLATGASAQSANASTNANRPSGVTGNAATAQNGGSANGNAKSGQNVTAMGGQGTGTANAANAGMGATNAGAAASNTPVSSSSTTTAATPANSGSMGPMGKANPHAPNPNASANAAAVQAVLQKFDTSRDQVIAQRQALIDQLAAAKTDAERNQVLQQMRQEQDSMQAEQRTTAKEIRNELQNLRRQHGGG